MSTTSPRLLTADEFARLPEPPDGSKQELIRGEVIMTPPPGFEHGLVQVQIASLLNTYARTTRRGRVTVESGVVTERDPDSVRGPDAAFWSAERIPLDQRPTGYPSTVPDLCVEVLSPSQRRSKVREKVEEYFALGVRLVWVVDPEAHTVAVYRNADAGRLLHESATLDGEDVLPGYSCRVGDLFS